MKNYNSNIKKSISYLKNNDCVGIPTETVYGLAANAYSDIAISKIYKLKKRPTSNPLIVHYHSLESLRRDCKINKNFLKLYKKFCPGPLTFILKLKKNSLISKKVTNGGTSLAIRFPKHQLIRKILKEINFPLAAPSANISTSISPVTKQDVFDEFGKNIKYILDGGRSKIGLESTILDLTTIPKLIRLGGLNILKIERFLNCNFSYKRKISLNYPGQSKIHYSPGIPIKLNIKKPKKHSAYLLISKKKGKNKNFFYLTKNKNLDEAGKNLYNILRQIKKKKYKLIEVEKIPNTGMGLAINDRLLRASAK